MESLSRTLWTVNADELPAQLFFETLRAGGGYKTFGLAPQGNIVIARAMAAEVERLGGSVRTGWSADTIELAAGRAVGVLATSAGGLAERLPADAVVSNAGPAATARMLARTEHEAAFAERAALAQPTSMLSLSFATGEDLLPRTPGILNFTDAERLSSVVHMTATCPDLAPPGRHLYEAYSVPRPSIGGVFDDHEECELLYADLRRALPGFTAAETIHLKVMRGANPALRAGPQGVPSVTTPVPNLVEVGDGVRPRASTGTSACALTAIEAVAALESTVRRTPDAAIA
jgi:phytoene dehydrogenase-like protein